MKIKTVKATKPFTFMYNELKVFVHISLLFTRIRQEGLNVRV